MIFEDFLGDVKVTRLKRQLIHFLMISLFLWGVGCARENEDPPHSRIKQEVTHGVDHSADFMSGGGTSGEVEKPSHLRLPLLLVSETSPLEAAADSSAIPLETTANQTVIQIHTKIGLRDLLVPDEKLRKDLFFSLPDQFLGKSVISVQYSHRVEGIDHFSRHGRDHILARKDRENHRFLIPFSRLFENLENYPETSADPEHLHILDLDLALKGEETQLITVQFQVTGPLPQPSPSPLPIDEKTSRERSRLAATDGWELVKEELENPYDRPVRFWFKASTEPFSLWQGLRMPVKFEKYGEIYVVINQELRKSSEGRIRLGRLRVLRDRQRIETIDLDSKGEGYLDLVAKEKVTIGWLAVAASGDDRASLPSALNAASFEFRGHHILGVFRDLAKYLYDECIKTGRLVHPLDFRSDPHSVTLEYKWEILTAELKGQWKREIRVAHPFTERDLVWGKQTLGDDLPINSFRNFKRIVSEQNSYELPANFDQSLMALENRFEPQGVYR